MRILLTAFVEDNRWSGMGKWARCIADGLIRLGHQPELWSASDFPLARRVGRLSVLLYPLTVAYRIWRAADRFDAVVIHEPGGLWYGLLRRLRPILPPLVVMCHNVESKHFAELLEADRRGLAIVPRDMRLKTPLFRLWQSDGAIKLADHVICLSSVDRDYVVHHLRRAPDRVTRLTNGVAAEDLAASCIKRPGQRVLFVGGWLDVKGRQVLPQLWSRVRLNFPDARLTVVGSGASPEQVLADFAEDDRASVSVIPRVADESEMAAQYGAHDVFLLPSLSEGSPLSLLEALAAGLPVVAARVGGVPDIVTHDTDGLLFEPLNPADGAAQVCRLLSETLTAERLARAAQSRAGMLTWDATTKSLAAVIKSVLSRSCEAIADASIRREGAAGDIPSNKVVE